MGGIPDSDVSRSSDCVIDKWYSLKLAKTTKGGLSSKFDMFGTNPRRRHGSTERDTAISSGASDGRMAKETLGNRLNGIFARW